MRLILIFIFLTKGLLIASSSWEMIDNNTYISSRDGRKFEYFIGIPVEINNTVYALNANLIASVVYSEDYCMNWDTTSCLAPLDYLGASTRFYDLVKNGTNLFVPADSGRLYRSFDKGKTWDYYLFENDIHPIQHLRFLNKNVGYLGMVDKHLLAKTTDGGKSWNPLPLVGDVLPEVFSFSTFVATSEEHIIVVGYDLTKPEAKLIFLETTDGGNSWHRFESEVFEKSKYVYFYYTNLTYHNGYFLVEYRYKNSSLGHTSLLKSKDFRTWEPLFISDTISGGKSITQIKFYNNIGIAMGTSAFIVSSDNGDTWVDLYDEKDTVTSFVVRLRSGFAYLDDGYVYCQGDFYYLDDDGLKRARPKIFRYKLDFANTSVELELSSLKVYPNPAETEITINYDKVIKSINILDLTGKKLFSKEYLNGAKNISLDVDFLQSGTYFLNINDKIYKRFVKN